MKIRQGFVSNSSSSSFVCDISGRVESGWDMSMSDAGMYECVNCHTIDEDYVKEVVEELAARGIAACVAALPEHVADTLQEEYDKAMASRICEGDCKSCNDPMDDQDMYDLLIDLIDEDRCSLPADVCPICSLRYIENADMLRYLLKSMDRTYASVHAEIRETYRQYPTGFYGYIRDVSLKTKIDN